MNENESRPRSAPALSYFILGAVIVLAASFGTTSGHNRPMLDATGQPIHLGGHRYPLYEHDTAAELRANWPCYVCGLVGIGFMLRAATIRFGSGALCPMTIPTTPHNALRTDPADWRR